MALSESWHVRNRGRECHASQSPFTEGQTIITALYPDPESSGYIRRDFCEEAWNNLDHSTDSPFSHWKTKFQPAPANETTPPVTKQNAEELLKTLVEEDQEYTENTRYILAVMLERQKTLRETDSQPTSSGILRIYEHRKSGEVFIIKDPNVPLDQVETIQNEVIELLSPKRHTPEPEPPQENDQAADPT